jgi:hypothetical protein
MSIFVLVHGAWQTASTWDLVTPRLRAAGHLVAIPLLSGLENDANPLTPASCKVRLTMSCAFAEYLQSVSECLAHDLRREVERLV